MRPERGDVQRPLAPKAPVDSVSNRSASQVSQQPLAPQTVSKSLADGFERVSWAVPADTLSSRDRSAVSPAFELSLAGRPLKFRLMLFPKESHQGCGGSSFKKAKGRGYIELKCETEERESEACPLTFRLFVGSQAPRGPVVHDFSHSAVKGLPKDSETWDLQKSIVGRSAIVGVEVVALHAAGSLNPVCPLRRLNPNPLFSLDATTTITATPTIFKI